jgi:hypothetical protein
MRKLLLPGLGIAAAIALSDCDSNHKSGSAASEQTSTVCGTYSGKGCASANKRVDLAVPSFSHSTEITNALFPIGHGRSAVLLGHVDGKPFRTETTVLPGRQTVDWNGRRIPVLISQYMAYLDGRLDEVAIDRYAQADDGSVWYLGEDVFDYRKGAIAITEGTWLAGREGPAAMIMPAHPKLGDVFRPENAIGIVFEEVTVTSVGKTVAGPRGPVAGAILTKELHSDRTTEDKLFAQTTASSAPRAQVTSRHSRSSCRRMRCRESRPRSSNPSRRERTAFWSCLGSKSGWRLTQPSEA